MSGGLWEIRTALPGHRAARVLFSIRQGRILLLHSFIKKGRKTPDDVLALARKRDREFAS
jgi:phage-related protein